MACGRRTFEGTNLGALVNKIMSVRGAGLRVLRVGVGMEVGAEVGDKGTLCCWVVCRERLILSLATSDQNSANW